jgi:hypothetical protein
VSLPTGGHYRSDEERQANARLIAAAPEMAAMLTDLLAAFDPRETTKPGGLAGKCGRTQHRTCAQAIDDARALLARIGGER